VNSNQVKATPVSKANFLISWIQCENANSKLVLELLTEENINIKNRLSEILRNMGESDGSFMEQIEYFHNCFLKEDEIIWFLRMEVTEQDKLLVRNMHDVDMLKLIKTNQKQLRQDIDTAEQEFHKLTFEFNSYLGEFL
jgi:hypothetical protein